MGIEEIPAAALLPSGAALQNAQQRLAAYQRIKHFQHRLETLSEFYRSESARIQAKIDADAKLLERLGYPLAVAS